MFNKKPKENASNDSEQISVEAEALAPHKKPMVFLFDPEKEVVEKFEELRFNFHEGTFGSAVKVNNSNNYDEKLLTLNHDYPPNLHEFDVVIMDLTNSKSENYDPDQHQLTNTSGTVATALLSVYPEQVFDPRPLSIQIAPKRLADLFDKTSVVIAFCSEEIVSEYQLVEITARGNNITGKKAASNFSFYHKFPDYKSRAGRKVKLPGKNTKLSPLFSKHLDKISFDTVFFHPKLWDEKKQPLDKNFVPLLLNEREEIVSFAHFVEKSIVFMFPNMEDKTSFLEELFKTHLPEFAPEIFPFHGQFKWLDSGDYPLPGEKKLLQNIAELEAQYKRDVTETEERLASLKEKYKFLSDLITETGDALVSAVVAYLKWLGFESVLNVDDTNPDIREEDIQVDCKDRFLVIEVKGIGGTSTDKDCSQISKIRYRRAEQRGSFDVFGLYIVNHQRYMPPKSRSNPPFTDNQATDALHDKRGLLTTYDLYRSYFLIEEGILRKPDVRESLFKIGLVVIEPENLTPIGTPNEIFKNGHIAIVNLNGTAINVGDTLIIKKQDDYKKAKIESLQVDDKEVDTCKTGDVGIKVNRKVRKNSELFIRKA